MILILAFIGMFFIQYVIYEEREAQLRDKYNEQLRRIGKQKYKKVYI
jgi:hypothetical protein